MRLKLIRTFMELFLMVLFILQDTMLVWGQVVCYTCAWSLMPLPSAQNESDVCRPQNFRPYIHTEVCHHGCIILILYENEEPAALGSAAPAISVSQNKSTTWKTIRADKNTTTSTTTTFTLGHDTAPRINMPINFYLRQCAISKGEGCEEGFENELGLYKRKCYCNENFCNGEKLNVAVNHLLSTYALLLMTIAIPTTITTFLA